MIRDTNTVPTVRIIAVIDRTSAVVDLVKKEVKTMGDSWSEKELAEFLRPYLEEFLSTHPPLTNEAAHA